MSQDVGGFGLQVIIFASKTFPAGLPISEFADDADPLDSPSIQIADKAMGLNGHLIRWGKAIPKGLTLNVIPGGIDDINLDILFSANTVGAGKRPVGDVITATVLYPDGTVKNFLQGAATDYMPANSVSSSARMKTKPYVFAFENITG
jgi:hypothetical protein